MSNTNPEGIHLVPTALGGVLVHTSNKHIVAATSTALAIPLSDTPFPEMEHYTVRYAHNSGLQHMMADNGLTNFWRYARVTGERLPVPISSQPVVTQVLSGILSCGLTICFGDPPAPASSDPRTNAATAWKQRGYQYECVPEIPSEANEMLEYFDNAYGMSNFAAGTAAQDCLWMHSKGDKSVAPGGGWVNMPWDTIATIRHDYLWLYLYGRSTSVRKISHGVRGSTTIGVAAPQLMIAEREAMEALAMEGFRGRAVAVWPPIIVNGVVIG
ncbi:hypothetical protein IQ06DRAFT_374766 [Phaeosphaeriaceae sp. SRC1lsM3a]|nr:hypothetical protein IQ06DRAFT_374766 [Stagonospora sp. SRC1lsM3a]